MTPPAFRVVIDSNVWISGMLTRTGAPAQVTRQVLRHGWPVFSADTFAELRERLWRPKFDRYVTIEQRQSLLGDLESVALWVEVPPAIARQPFCRDGTDDKFIHAALAAGAGWLISGDQDLLVLAERLLPLGLRIVSPAEVLALPEFAARP